MSGFALVILSALFHASWNVLLKKAKSKFRFNLNIHLSSVAVFTVILLIFYPDKISFEKDVILIGAAGALFFSAYHLLITKAYQLSDVSQVYPVTNSSPLFVAVWASLFLGEKLNLFGWLGIIVTIVGCLVMNGASVKKSRIEKGVIVALLAALAYSFGAPFDKLGVNTGNAIMYSYYMNTFMALFFWIVFRLNHSDEPVCKEDRKWIWPAGLIIVASTITYRFGLIEIPISYGVAVRQVSGIFGVIMGMMFFKEGYGRMRFVGSLIIVTGVALLFITAQ